MRRHAAADHMLVIATESPDVSLYTARHTTPGASPTSDVRNFIGAMGGQKHLCVGFAQSRRHN